MTIELIFYILKGMNATGVCNNSDGQPPYPHKEIIQRFTKNQQDKRKFNGESPGPNKKLNNLTEDENKDQIDEFNRTRYYDFLDHILKMIINEQKFRNDFINYVKLEYIRTQIFDFKDGAGCPRFKKMTKYAADDRFNVSSHYLIIVAHFYLTCARIRNIELFDKEKNMFTCLSKHSIRNTQVSNLSLFYLFDLDTLYSISNKYSLDVINEVVCKLLYYVIFNKECVLDNMIK